MHGPTARTANPGLRAIWFGFLAPPIAYAIDLVASSVLVPYACATGLVIVLHASTVTFAVLAASAGVTSLAVYRRVRLMDERPGRQSREFLSASGLILSPLFVLLIVFSGYAKVLIDPCLK
jgi:hypothetical protein